MYHLLLALAAVAGGQDGAASIDRLLACEQAGDDAHRLACFEAQVRAIRAQRAQVARVLDAPRKTPVAFTPVDATITTVSSLRPGFWLVALSDGSTWQNSEWTGASPSAGKSVRIRKGALGSLWATTDAIGSVKVRRVVPR